MTEDLPLENGTMAPVTDYSTIPPRPIKTASILRAAAEETTNQLILDCKFPVSSKEDTIADIIKYCNDFEDGYVYAKRLDYHCHWNCDMAVAEVLDSYNTAIYEAQRDAQAVWAKQYNVQPALALQSNVFLKTGETGIITNIGDNLSGHNVACYLVKIDGEDQSTHQRRVVYFEDAILSKIQTQVAVPTCEPKKEDSSHKLFWIKNTQMGDWILMWNGSVWVDFGSDATTTPKRAAELGWTCVGPAILGE